MVTDLPGQARQLEHWLSVSLDPEAAASDTQLRGKHVSAQTPEASVGRWRREMPAELAEQFSRELGEELEALGYDLPRSGPRQGGRRRRSPWPGTPDAIPPSPAEDKVIETTPRLPDAGAGSSGRPRHDAAKEAQLLEDQGERLREQGERLREQENVLRAMLGSRAFAVAEQLSRLHQRGRPMFSRQQVRRALGEEDGRV
jgi:hypothetical protein